MAPTKRIEPARVLFPYGMIQNEATKYITLVIYLLICLRKRIIKAKNYQEMDSLHLSRGATIGICAYNEGKNISRLLENILRKQKLPALSEVIVVCSGCTDRTVEIAREYANEDSRIRVLVENQRRGKASAINQILAHADSDAILFLSADTLPNLGCFQRLSSQLPVSSSKEPYGVWLPRRSRRTQVWR